MNRKSSHIGTLKLALTAFKNRERLVELSVQNKAVQGRKMRVDATVVETNIQYPTDGSRLDEGPRLNAADEEDDGGGRRTGN